MNRHIELKTKPIPLNQMYRCFNGRYLKSKKGRETAEALQWELKEQWGASKPLKSRVALNILLYFGDKRKRDIDAYLKILLDSMEGIVYEDDNQIVEMHVFKEYDKENPRVVIGVI